MLIKMGMKIVDSLLASSAETDPGHSALYRAQTKSFREETPEWHPLARALRFLESRHHGSKAAFYLDFMKAILPKYAGFFCAAGNDEYKQAHCHFAFLCWQTINTFGPMAKAIFGDET